MNDPAICPEPGALGEYLDGILGDPRRATSDPRAIARHLETCDRCRTELDAIAQISRLLAVAEDTVRADPNFLPRFRQRLDRALGTSAETWRRLALRLAPFSVAALVAAVAVVVVEPSMTETFFELERRVLATGSPSGAEIASANDWTADWVAGPLSQPPGLRRSR